MVDERSNDNVWAEIEYTVRDSKYDEEKPYDIRYDIGGAIPMTNTTNECKLVHIQNFRPIQDASSFDKFGFSVERMGVPLTDWIFNEQSNVETIVYPAIKELLWRKFPNASGVHILEHSLRRRHPDFPSLDEKLEVEYTQPTRLVHVDFSLESAVKTARSAFNLSPDQSRRVLAINLWKSLQGPGNDWPLAICDKRTLDHAADCIVTDVVYHNRFTENEKVFHDSQHKWYYVKDIADEEIIMFLQKDSVLETGGGVAHTSFNNPNADPNALPRTSIELRAFVVYSS